MDEMARNCDIYHRMNNGSFCAAGHEMALRRKPASNCFVDVIEEQVRRNVHIPICISSGLFSIRRRSEFH
jgi:hypothetical protein